MRDHDSVTPVSGERIQQLSNQLSSRFFLGAGKFIEDREIIRGRPFAEGKLPGIDAPAIRTRQHRAYRNPQALERRTDILGFSPTPFVEVSLARTISIFVSSLSGNKAVCRHVAKQDNKPAFPERLDQRPPLQARLERLALRESLDRGQQQDRNHRSHQNSQCVSNLRSDHGCEFTRNRRGPTAPSGNIIGLPPLCDFQGSSLPGSIVTAKWVLAAPSVMRRSDADRSSILPA